MTNQERAKVALPFVQAMVEGKVVEAMAFSDNTRWWVAQFGDLNPRLERAEEMLRIRHEKRRVPLTAKDFIGVTDVKEPSASDGVRSAVRDVEESGFYGDDYVFYTWEDAMKLGLLISTTHGCDWKPCWKEAEE